VSTTFDCVIKKITDVWKHFDLHPAN